MPDIGFHKIPIVYCLGSFHQNCSGCLLLFTLAKNIEKTLNTIILPSKFESTLHTSDLDIAQFPNIMKNNIQMKNTCPSEAGSMNTNLENNKKNPKIMECTITVSKQCNFHTPKKKLLQTNLSPLEHPVYS
jgi:hypothetical protein